MLLFLFLCFIFKEIFMKKQMFSLMLSTAIFTTTPLLAMDDDTNNGSFRVLPQDATIRIIEELPVNGVLTFSVTSKAMYALCETPLIWKNISARNGIKLDPESEEKEKDQILNHFTIFHDITKPQKVKIFQLISWKNELYSDSLYQASYRFVIGKRQLQLINSQSGPDKLELLDPNAFATFSWVVPTNFPDGLCHVPNHWGAYVQVCTDQEKTKDLKFNSPEYAKIAHEGVISGTSMGNYFKITEIKENKESEKN